MDKITFQKAIETLKATECSTNEKIKLFSQIQSSLEMLVNHTTYKNHVSNAIQILLLFCEDNDSNCRISAEENLNQIIRSCERSHQIAIVQIDLYHEMKKNGNERSLRICLNLFSHFIPLIKYRRQKVYAQNLLPTLLAIGKRKETLVIESLSDFMINFSKYLLNCLSDGEIVKLVDLFLDNLTISCAIKRRCSAQNLIAILKHLVKKDFAMKSIIANAQENMDKNLTSSAVLGTLGLLRLLMPVMIQSAEYHQKVIELLETCLNFLKTETSHSIINANLEVLYALISSADSRSAPEFKHLLNDKEMHKEMLLSKHSVSVLRNIDSRKSSSAETLRMQDNFLQLPSTSASFLSTSNKSLTDFSDVEVDSFKSIEFDAEMSSSPGAMKNLIERGAETMSLKSADSINSFFNSILTHSNTDTVSKFFKKSSTESPAHQAKFNESIDDKSLEFSLSLLKDEQLELPDSQTLPETAEMALEDTPKLEETLEPVESSTSIAVNREFYIGTIFDQSCVEYIVRLVTSKFLLDGSPKVLISDQTIRVSIKNLALSVIVACVNLHCDVLLMKLQKDFTDESMMVESLLSYLVDEDLRLEEEESNKESAKQDVAATSDGFLEIKDDYFGECTTATFLDYFSPLSKSIDDQGLISLKNKLYEEKSKDREENAKKINRDLCQLLSKSETIESKYPLMETTLKMPEDKDCQFVADVLRYSTHSDPVLRGNVYMIIGIFLKGIFTRNLDYEQFIGRSEFIKEPLDLNVMIQYLMNGLIDGAHTVVKQTLTALECCLNALLDSLDPERIQMIMNHLLLVFCNKYWLVQCKYCDVVVKINFRNLKKSIGLSKTEIYQKQIVNQLFEFIKDSDFRVRNHASESFPLFITNLSDCTKTFYTPLEKFVDENLLRFESFFVEMKINQEGSDSKERQLTKILYRLSNLLMDLKDKNQQFGVIYALKVLTRCFSPLAFSSWREFKILQILMSFVNKNPGVALDISCQCDMMEIISSLIVAEGRIENSLDTSEFLKHIMRIVNIYGHLLTNTKPLLIPKGTKTKSDIFMSSKELAHINSIGFFSNDNFYLKLYLVLKNSIESYRITINRDAEYKLKHLLHVTLKSLQTLIELKAKTKDFAKVLDEIIHYIVQLMNFQPEDCIITTKILLKFVFQKNFCNRQSELNSICKHAENNDSAAVFKAFESFKSYNATEIIKENSIEISIKLFDPLVIQCLRLFSKSPAKTQAIILDMLCQLLEFNVSYMQLDSKKVFVDFVMRQLDFLEGGQVIDGHLLAPKIVEFLIFLAKLKDKKLVTIPKIINIIDTLLAATNQVVKDCGIDAMLVLAMELFFKRNEFKGDNDSMKVYTEEINAQREVMISMMLKFLHRGTQDHLIWILMKLRVEPSLEHVIDEDEIFVQLVQAIKDEPSGNHKLISAISKNILLESKNFEMMLSHYWSLLTADADQNKLKTIVLIAEHILIKAEEVYLINHLKLHHQKKRMSSSEVIQSFVNDHLKFLITIMKKHHDENCCYIKDFLNFMKFEKLPTFLLAFKQSNIDTKEFIRKASCNEAMFDVVINFLLSVNVDQTEMLETLMTIEAVSQPKLLDIFHKNLFISKNDINKWNNSELMEFFKESPKLAILLKYSGNVLLDSLLEDEKISKIIVRKLPKMKLPLERMKYLLENIHESCMSHIMEFVIMQSVKEPESCRYIQLITIKRLKTIKNEQMMGKEMMKMSEEDCEKVRSKMLRLDLETNFPSLARAIQDFIGSFNGIKTLDVDQSDLNRVIDEAWLLNKAKQIITKIGEPSDGLRIVEMLHEIKSESKLVNLLSATDFNLKLLPSTFKVSFKKMLKNFRADCIQINPHLNYMKVSPLLKISTLILMRHLENIDDHNGSDFDALAQSLSVYLRWIRELYSISLIYIEARFVEKFVADHFLKSCFNSTILKFLSHAIQRFKHGEPSELMLNVVQEILMQNILWTEVNKINNSCTDELVSCIHKYLSTTLGNSDFANRYQHPTLFEELSNTDVDSCQILTAKQVVFIAILQEAYEDGDFSSLIISSKARKIVEKCFSISRYLLRLNRYFQFTLTPYEILLSYRSGDDLVIIQSEGRFKLKQIPIEYLNDSELLERYIRRINRYGFDQRQEFEEFFMTLLVLLNQWNDLQEAEEQLYIKQLCLQTNIDLILSCFRFPSIGIPENKFLHLPRSEKIQMDNIGLKKLHHIQELLDSELNIFYQPNMERIEFAVGNDVIGCHSFQMNQFALNYTWQMIETNSEVASSGSVMSRNIQFFHEKCGIDFKSAIQLIFDLITQMIDENAMMVLPQLAKLIEILDNSEQFKWINRKMMELFETIASEDTISHQYIIYLLCRSYAVLVPTLSELQQLQPILNKYLGSNQMFVRNASLQGLLCLFESLVKTNTTIGGMNDELILVRNIITGYTTKNGIIFESTFSSHHHDKLVWTINFYVIEMTSRFLPDCDLLANSIISANNILKRTSDLDLYYLIVNGLERLVILNPANKLYREKVEKLSLDLLKLDNKLFSVGGLKLLISCLYIGSLEQLELTEKSNGIVQDEPEIIIQSTEKIEILFSCIRTATIDEAEIYGNVLGQVLKDLLPPNEILTKVVKELLILNQSNTVVIATIIHQVFRTAIDSSYLSLLQDWLICSLQNFLGYPNLKKSIWFLSIIFLSSTLNQNLLKVFPILLDEAISSADLCQIFLISAKDFNDRLSTQQRLQFKEALRARKKTRFLSSFASTQSPMSSHAFNNNLFEILLTHL